MMLKKIFWLSDCAFQVAKRWITPTFLALFVSLGWLPVSAAAPIKVGSPIEAKVVDVLDGQTFTAEDTHGALLTIRLEGVIAPLPASSLQERSTSDSASRACEALRSLIAGTDVKLVPADTTVDASTDRYGRIAARAYRNDGASIETEMLSRGFLRVDPTVDNNVSTQEMLTIEAQARQSGVGLWSDPDFAVRAATTMKMGYGEFAIVEGVVTKATRTKAWVYLNFGSDWRSDFTVGVPVSALAAFAKAGLDPLTLSGTNIRIRGWLQSYNGPWIEARSPEQIEIASEP